MSYASAVDRLYALGQELTPPSTGSSAGRLKFDLNHMRILAGALGDPQKTFPSILIAGTNGKGSTAATLASIMVKAGCRTGLYTSPHLARVNERIRVNTQALETTDEGTLIDIPDETFARLYFQVDETARVLVQQKALPHPPSYFEVLTALGFLYFAEQKVDLAIVEVGLGGRLDATNIVDPLVSIITDIALDHQDYLGSTITEIAREKAGILRANGTLVTLPQHPEANQAIGEAAVSLNVRGVSAAPFLPDREYVGRPASEQDCTESPVRPNHYPVTAEGVTLQVRSPLAGQHQQRNLALALATAFELRSNHGYDISNAAMESGIATTYWPGRLEFLPPNVLLDVAHNPAGAWTLRSAIAALPDDRPRTLLFSCLRDKDLREMAQILFPLFDRTRERPHDNMILVQIDNVRAEGIEKLLAAARALDIPAHTAPDLEASLALARSLTHDGGLIVATGSLYLVGPLRELVLRG